MLADSGASNRWRLLHWFISSATFSVPQAAGPIAFSLVALNLTGDASRGAAIVLAMTLAQVAGAIPIAWLGRNWPAAAFLSLLVGIRTAALVLISTLAASGAPFIYLILAAAVGGSVNGAAHGYLRFVLKALTPAERLPRALGVAATLNELTLVLAPVAASGLGTVSPAFAVLALAGGGRPDPTGAAEPRRPRQQRALRRRLGAQPTHPAVAAVFRCGRGHRCGHRDWRRRAGAAVRLRPSPGFPVHRSSVHSLRGWRGLGQPGATAWPCGRPC